MHFRGCPPLAPNTPAGVLFVGHGSRDAVGAAEFLETARLLARRVAHLPVEACFLEFATPTIGSGVERLVRQGVRHVVVLPALLFAAGHANRDVPDAVETAIRASECGMRHEAEGRAVLPIRWEQAGHIGCHRAVLEASCLRDREVTGAAAAGGDSWRRLLVGRGSGDPAATQEMLEFARLRGEGWGLSSEVCFLAVAEPSLPVALGRIAAARPARVVVQPHLLFSGLLTAEIGEQVAAVARATPDTEWRVSPPLGATELVIDALCDRLRETSLGSGLRRDLLNTTPEVVGEPSQFDLAQADLARSRAAGYDLD